MPLLPGSKAVHLVMSEAAAPPVVPVGQAREFIQKSRSDMYDGYVYKGVSVRTAAPTKSSSNFDGSGSKSGGSSREVCSSYGESRGMERTNPMQRQSDNFSSSGSDNGRNGRQGYSDMDDGNEDEYHRRRMEWDRQEREARRRARDGGRDVDGMNMVFNNAAEVGSNLADAAGDAAAAAASTGIRQIFVIYIFNIISLHLHCHCHCHPHNLPSYIMHVIALSAAGSLFSFAAKSLQVAAEVGTSVVTGSTAGVIKVGRRKVSIMKELAEGGFGKVYLVQDQDTGTDYAMKHMMCQSTEQEQDVQDELAALQRFRGQSNIIHLVDSSSISRRGDQGMYALILTFVVQKHIHNAYIHTYIRTYMH